MPSSLKLQLSQGSATVLSLDSFMYHRTLTVDNWSSGNQFKNWVKPIRSSIMRLSTKKKRLILWWWDLKLKDHLGAEGELVPRPNRDNVICHCGGRRRIMISEETMVQHETDPSNDEEPCGDRRKETKIYQTSFWPPLSLVVFPLNVLLLKPSKKSLIAQTSYSVRREGETEG